MRNKCGDCKYVLPNVIIPYIKKHSLATDLYLFDLQKSYDIAVNESATQEEKEAYQNLKDKFGLSEQGNATFGFSILTHSSGIQDQTHIRRTEISTRLRSRLQRKRLNAGLMRAQVLRTASRFTLQQVLNLKTRQRLILCLEDGNLRPPLARLVPGSTMLPCLRTAMSALKTCITGTSVE